VLKTGNFAHLALANPKLAPYGAAAVSVLQNLKLYSALEPKLVLGENVGQTHQFVVSGSAPLGFVARSQVYQGDKLTSGSAWIVPANLYRPLRQDAVVLAKGQGKSAALAFVKFLKSPQAQALIRFHGYAL
jgi:molybdate transport system substrate-binding protein